jgi:hypothetical protein
VAAYGTPASTAANAANIDVIMDGPLNYYVRMRRLDTSAEYHRGPLLIEY